MGQGLLGRVAAEPGTSPGLHIGRTSCLISLLVRRIRMLLEHKFS